MIISDVISDFVLKEAYCGKPPFSVAFIPNNIYLDKNSIDMVYQIFKLIKTKPYDQRLSSIHKMFEMKSTDNPIKNNKIILQPSGNINEFGMDEVREVFPTMNSLDELYVNIGGDTWVINPSVVDNPYSLEFDILEFAKSNLKWFGLSASSHIYTNSILNFDQHITNACHCHQQMYWKSISNNGGLIVDLSFNDEVDIYEQTYQYVYGKFSQPEQVWNNILLDVMNRQKHITNITSVDQMVFVETDLALRSRPGGTTNTYAGHWVQCHFKKLDDMDMINSRWFGDTPIIIILGGKFENANGREILAIIYGSSIYTTSTPIAAMFGVARYTGNKKFVSPLGPSYDFVTGMMVVREVAMITGDIYNSLEMGKTLPSFRKAGNLRYDIETVRKEYKKRYCR